MRGDMLSYLGVTGFVSKQICLEAWTPLPASRHRHGTTETRALEELGCSEENSVNSSRGTKSH